QVWVGIKKDLTDNEWYWIDGRNVEANVWRSGQPDGAANGENCARLVDPDFLAADVSCDANFAYMCIVGPSPPGGIDALVTKSSNGVPTVKSIQSKTTTTPTSTVAPCEPSFTLVENVGCAKTYTGKENRMTYINAREVCKTNGGDLAAPNNVADLKAFMKTEFTPNNNVWVGIERKQSDNEWYWINGRNVEMNEWGSDKPDGTENDNCAMLQGPEWVAAYVSCDKNILYMCIVDPSPA
ncbi:unnamed protein product, partial [Meganyctiphanes norvegica]